MQCSSQAQRVQQADHQSHQEPSNHLQRRVADELLELFLIGERLLELCEQIDKFVQQLCLLAGLDGIERGLTPPESITENIFDMSDEERKADGIDSLPGSLEEAVNELEKSDFCKEALGDHVFKKFIEAKRKEWDGYRTSISQWEIDNYLARY